MKLTMAQAIIRYLDSQYVTRDGKENKFIAGVWGIFGHGNVAGIGEALEQNKKLKHFLPRNEQAMVHASVAYAKQNRRLKIFACTSSIGPGATNMITAAAGATINRLPVLLLPGDVFSRRNVGPVLQQLEHTNSPDISVNDCFKPVSVFWDRINRPEQIISSLPEALRVLTDPALTGAVTLSLPQDVQAEAYDYPELFFNKRVWTISRNMPSEESLINAVSIINKSSNPVIIAGGGVIYSDAEKALSDFCENTGIPVGETQAGKGAISWRHNQSVGAVGVTGTSAANIISRYADLVICIGTRLSDFTTASKTLFKHPNVTFLSINISSFDAHKHSSLSLVGDAKACLEKLNHMLNEEGFTISHEYKNQISQQKDGWDQEVNRIFNLNNKPAVSQGEVIGLVSEFMNEDDTVICAAGSLPGDMHKLWRTVNGNQYHMEYGYSCMGYEIAGGLGVRMAKDSGDVFIMVGDGSYLMMNSEIVTAVQENQKLIIILVNNHGFGSINNLSLGLGSKGFGNQYRKREKETGEYTGDKLPVDYAAHAESMGIDATKVQTKQELEESLNQARESDASMMIEVLVDHSIGVPGYESWWDVPVAEVSQSDKVTKIRKDYDQKIKDERNF
jgi:3D-(3,5/4)-trihydroxycyclohexane-1,2-dione acylhydrolase (decyclizing)